MRTAANFIIEGSMVVHRWYRYMKIDPNPYIRESWPAGSS